MKRLSTHLLGLSLLLPACALPQHDENLTVDAALAEDGGAPDAASDAALSASLGGQASLGHTSAPLAVASPKRAQVKLAPVPDTQVAVSATPVPAAEPVAEAPVAVPESHQVLFVTSPALVAKLRDEHYDAERDCKGVMSEAELCACLSGPIPAEYGDSYQGSCTHTELGVPGFAVLNDGSGGTYIIGQAEAGWYRLTYLHDAGIEGYSVSGARMMRSGTLSVLAIDASESGGCGYGDWDAKFVELCALHDPSSRRFGHCVQVPVWSHSTSRDPDTEVSTESESSFGFRLSDHGSVKIYPKGKISKHSRKLTAFEHRL